MNKSKNFIPKEFDQQDRIEEFHQVGVPLSPLTLGDSNSSSTSLGDTEDWIDQVTYEDVDSHLPSVTESPINNTFQKDNLGKVELSKESAKDGCCTGLSTDSIKVLEHFKLMEKGFYIPHPKEIELLSEVLQLDIQVGDVLTFTEGKWINRPGIDLVNTLLTLDNNLRFKEGSALRYESGKWVESFLPKFDRSKISRDKDLLIYNKSTETWVNTSIEEFNQLITLTEMFDMDSIANGYFMFNKLPNGVVEPVGIDQVITDKIKESISLNDLSDVKVEKLLSEQVLVWNSATQLWVNKNLSDYLKETIESYTDFLEVITQHLDPQEGDMLMWKDGKWGIHKRIPEFNSLGFNTGDTTGKILYWDSVNSEINSIELEDALKETSLKSLIEKDIQDPSVNYVSMFNPRTQEWEFISLDVFSKFSEFQKSLGDLTNVSSSNPRDRDFLVFDSSRGEWISLDLDTLIEERYEGSKDFLDSLDKKVPVEATGNDIIFIKSPTDGWNPVTIESLKDSIVKDTPFDFESIGDGYFLFYTDPVSGKVTPRTAREMIEAEIIETLTLNELADVKISSRILNNQILVWDSATQLWVNKDIREFFEEQMENYPDFLKWATQHLNPQDGDMLVYANGEWGLRSDIPNFYLGNPVDHSIMIYESSTNSWKDATIDFILLESKFGNLFTESEIIPQGDGIHITVFNPDTQTWELKSVNEARGILNINNLLNKLEDVSVNSLSELDILAWDNSAKKWKNIDFQGLLNESDEELADLLRALAELNPTSEDTLVYRNGNWTLDKYIPIEFPGANTEMNQILVWNSTSGRYESKHIYQFLDMWELMNSSTPEDLKSRRLGLRYTPEDGWFIEKFDDYAKELAKVTKLEYLFDTKIERKLNNHILTWDNANYKWVNKSIVTILQEEIEGFEGAVNSVTGELVDNGDPKNPIVNTPTLNQVTNKGYITDRIVIAKLPSNLIFIELDAVNGKFLFHAGTQSLDDLDDDSVINKNILLNSASQIVTLGIFGELEW